MHLREECAPPLHSLRLAKGDNGMHTNEDNSRFSLRAIEVNKLVKGFSMLVRRLLASNRLLLLLTSSLAHINNSPNGLTYVRLFRYCDYK